MFKFTIRDLLWLTVVVSLVCAWWVDHHGLQQDRDIWKYHAEGAKQLASWGATGIEFDGKDMTAKHHTSGTYARTWPEQNWWRDDPHEGPNRPKRWRVLER
jgi:hypothetical protein